jgi:hypothetical protein
MEESNNEEPERPHLTLKNRMAQYPVVRTTQERLNSAKEEIVRAAMEATCELDLQILHSKMDDLLKFDE